MTDLSKLRELIEEVEKAEEGSCWLDAKVAVVLRFGPVGGPAWINDKFPVWRARDDGRVEVVHNDGKGGVHWEPLACSISLDAVEALVPEGWRSPIVYPDWYCDGRFSVETRRKSGFGDVLVAKGKTECLARLALCLRAHLHELENRDG